MGVMIKCCGCDKEVPACNMSPSGRHDHNYCCIIIFIFSVVINSITVVLIAIVEVPVSLWTSNEFISFQL